jgi:hypothetical protein
MAFCGAPVCLPPCRRLPFSWAPQQRRDNQSEAGADDNRQHRSITIVIAGRTPHCGCLSGKVKAVSVLHPGRPKSACSIAGLSWGGAADAISHGFHGLGEFLVGESIGLSPPARQRRQQWSLDTAGEWAYSRVRT